MLRHLSIRNVVVIERLDLDFNAGLTTFTGETGAGKSILLDALGLALGARAEMRLMRFNATICSVGAVFSVPDTHACRDLLRTHGFSPDPHEDLVLRRVLRRDGRNQAFVNDQPVSGHLLRGLGDSLVEMQSRSERRGLFDERLHGKYLDVYGGLEDLARRTRDSWLSYRDSRQQLQTAKEALTKTRSLRESLSQRLADLQSLAPQEGEEARLADKRRLLQTKEQLLSCGQTAFIALEGNEEAESDGGAGAHIDQARRSLQAIDHAPQEIARAHEALSRAAVDVAEAAREIRGFFANFEQEGESLVEIDDRYFALLEAAHRESCAADELPSRCASLAETLERLDTQEEHLHDIARQVSTNRRTYLEVARLLSEKRKTAAHALENAVTSELGPLRLGNCVFRVSFDSSTSNHEPDTTNPSTRNETSNDGANGRNAVEKKRKVAAHMQDEPPGGKGGLEKCRFLVQSDGGSSFGPLGSIASEGELARFLLALRVVLSGVGNALMSVFDEADRGVGGKTAHAVGERLAMLACTQQVLAVTHSPQVAARAQHHLHISKRLEDDGVPTIVSPLSGAERSEEIARMLSGARITDEARAAAESLLHPPCR